MEENIIFDKEAPLNTSEQEFYDIAVLTKQALVGRMSDEEMEMPDIMDEWKRLECNNYRQESEEKPADSKPIKYHHWRRNIAATIIGMAVLSGIALAGVYIAKGVNQKSNVPVDTIKTERKAVATPEESQEVVFDDIPLSDMMYVIAKFYNVKLVFEDEGVKSIRMFYTFDKTKYIEKVVSNLNHFNKISVTYEEETIKITRR